MLFTKYYNCHFYVGSWYSTINTTMFFNFPYHNKLCKELVLLFYHDNTVNADYNQKVNDKMYLFVHGSIW